MPHRPLRSFLAIFAVVGSALPGFVGASASAAPAEPVVPSGGCWRYTPAAGAAIDATTGHTDLSTAIEPWAADPKMTFGTAGDTAVGGIRTFTLDLAGGPSVSPPAPVEGLPGTATYLFDALDTKAVRTPLAPIVVDFEVKPGGTAIPAMQAAGSVPLAEAGTSALILRSVYFDFPGPLGLPGTGERLACNGQKDGAATPLVNPATTPLDTSVMTSVTSVASTGLAVRRVVGQKVLDAARPGDAVELALTGFPSEVKVALGLCGPAAQTAPGCGQPVEVTTSADGSAAATFVVPKDAATGAGTVRVRARIADTEATFEQPMRVLGEPAIELRKTGAKNRLRVVGAEWDPTEQVRVMALDDAGDQVGKAATVNAGATGRIDARLAIDADAEVVAVVAQQERADETLEATVDVPVTSSGADSGAGGDSSGGSSGGTDASAGTNTSGAPAAAAPVLPLDIPAPVDLPVTTVVDPVTGAAGAVDALAVTKVNLSGSTRFGDLFGRGPDRVLKLRVENISDADVIAPGLSIAVGKGDDAEPVYASDGFGRLAPGESLDLEVPIGLPAGAVGVYTISGQLGAGESGSFSLAWETYPWGLFGLNALGILLIAFAVRRRMTSRAPNRLAALAGPPGAVATSGSDESAAVIDLAVLERWWAMQAADDARDSVDAMADAVVDVDAVERWLERCSARSERLR